MLIGVVFMFCFRVLSNLDFKVSKCSCFGLYYVCTSHLLLRLRLINHGSSLFTFGSVKSMPCHRQLDNSAMVAQQL